MVDKGEDGNIDKYFDDSPKQTLILEEALSLKKGYTLEEIRFIFVEDAVEEFKRY